jgi:hypothetical protein
MSAQTNQMHVHSERFMTRQRKMKMGKKTFSSALICALLIQAFSSKVNGSSNFLSDVDGRVKCVLTDGYLARLPVLGSFHRST